MRAVQSPRAVAVPAQSAMPMLVRALIALVAIMALMFVASPAVVHAQDSTATHKVLSGETLWSLSARFYGDGHKWHDLARLNGLGDNGEKGIAVGQVIKVPVRKSAGLVGVSPTKPAVTDSAAQRVATEKASAAKSAAAEKAAQKSADKAVAEKASTEKPASEKPVEAKGSPASGGALASQTAGKADAVAKAPSKSTSKTVGKPASKQVASTGARASDGKAVIVRTDSAKSASTQQARNQANAEDMTDARTHIWGVDIPSQRASRGKDVATVFQGHTYDREDVVSATPLSRISEAPRARTGEFEAAPFPLAQAHFNSAAVVGRRVGAAAAGSSREVDRLLLADEAEVQLPAGTAAIVGARYMAVTMGPELAPGVRLAVPSGVLQIVRADAGKLPVARVARQSGIISQGEYLIQAEGSPAAPGAKAAVIGGNGGPESHVLWVREGELLPTVQSYLVLAAGEKEGVAPGDEFWLVSKQGVGADAREQRIAVVRVVRVTNAGSSAIVIQQDQPAIAAGVAARRVAKVN